MALIIGHHSNQNKFLTPQKQITMKNKVENWIQESTNDLMHSVDQILGDYFELPEGTDTKEFNKDMAWLRRNIEIELLNIARRTATEIKNNISTNF